MNELPIELESGQMPAEPTTQWDDPRVQQVYKLLCAKEAPPLEQHWEGWIARRIVDALFTEPMPAASIAIDFKQATELLALFGGEATIMRLTIGDIGHSGPGLYAWYDDLPEEGAVFLGQADDEAVPADIAVQHAAAIDQAFEAVRKVFCKLQRYSFLLDASGSVRRVRDRCGNWVDFDDAHALFDPVSVDAAVGIEGLTPASTARLPAPFTASVMRDDGGARPFWCLMAAYQNENEAALALAVIYRGAAGLPTSGATNAAKNGRVLALSGDMGRRFELHHGAGTWTDQAFRKEASTWASAWRAATAHAAGEPAQPSSPAAPVGVESLIDAVRKLPTVRAPEIDGEESDGTPRYWRSRPYVSLTQLERLLAARAAQPAAFERRLIRHMQGQIDRLQSALDLLPDRGVSAIAAAQPATPAAPSDEPATVLAILNSAEWTLSRHPASTNLTEEWSRSHAWSVQRAAAPYCDADGSRVWFGETAIAALRAAHAALKMQMTVAAVSIPDGIGGATLGSAS